HEEPPISAQVLRNHQGLTPTGPPSGTDEDTRPFRPSHNDEGFSDPDDTVRLQPRSVRPAPSSLKGGAPSPAPDTLNDGPSPRPEAAPRPPRSPAPPLTGVQGATDRTRLGHGARVPDRPDRKSTRLNSSHVSISYAVFCLNKKRIDTSNKMLRNTR